MAHLELGRSNAGILATVGDLAQRFRSHVIGVAACQPMRFIYGEGYVSAGLFEQDLADKKKESVAAEAEFRDALQTRASSIEWRSTVVSGTLAGHLAREARSVDLIVTGAASGGSSDASQSVNVSDLIMQAGRPVLLTASAGAPKFERVLLAWKDTLETRRAAFEALPLMKKAAHVVVAEIAGKSGLAAAQDNLDEVLRWLKRHGIVAESAATLSTGDDASQLRAIALASDADVIVAGAYGHSRLREWILGGVTRDLLLRPDRCALVSH